jgi:hypothetical protein
MFHHFIYTFVINPHAAVNIMEYRIRKYDYSVTVNIRELVSRCQGNTNINCVILDLVSM